jgi:hypothetical protein
MDTRHPNCDRWSKSTASRIANKSRHQRVVATERVSDRISGVFQSQKTSEELFGFENVEQFLPPGLLDDE